MHLKNFSMIDNGGKWTLAPAYDLLNVAIVNPADDDELALTINGKKKKLKRKHFIKFAEGLGLNALQIRNVFRRFVKNRSSMFDWIDRSFLSPDYKIAYKRLVDLRYKALEIDDYNQSA